MILTNDHPEEEYLHKPEVARHVAVVPGGGSLIHHPEVGDQVQIPWCFRYVESN